MEFDGTQKLIGKGAQAEVVLYHGYAYKIYQQFYPTQWILSEVRNQEKLNKGGYTPVKFYDTDDKRIIKMDYVEGEPLEVRANKGDLKAFDILADAFKTIHEKPCRDIPYDSLNGDISFMLKGEEKEFAYKYEGIFTKKYGECICHRDLHFLNIMVAPGSDDYTVIDWVNARKTPFIFDYARTYVIFDEFSKEGLEIYKQRVLPHMWAQGVTEEDFEMAVKVCLALRKAEKTFGQKIFGYKKDLMPKLEEMGFTLSEMWRDEIRVYSDTVPSKETIKKILTLLTCEQELQFWDKFYGKQGREISRYVDVIVMGDYVAYHFSGHGWSSGYYRMSIDEMADLIVKSWEYGANLSDYSFKNFILIGANQTSDWYMDDYLKAGYEPAT